MISSGAYGIKFSSLEMKGNSSDAHVGTGYNNNKKKLGFKPVVTRRLTGFARIRFLAGVGPETSSVET